MQCVLFTLSTRFISDTLIDTPEVFEDVLGEYDVEGFITQIQCACMGHFQFNQFRCVETEIAVQAPHYSRTPKQPQPLPCLNRNRQPTLTSEALRTWPRLCARAPMSPSCIFSCVLP
jgi:hypothetical protein